MNHPLAKSIEQMLVTSAPPGSVSAPRIDDYVTPSSTIPGLMPTVSTPHHALPRYVQEVWSQAVARVPALAAVAILDPIENAARVFDLVDSRYGYELVHALMLPEKPAVFIFRRIDPVRAPVSLATF